MKLAIASGKGGTGKTTVATNLAWIGDTSFESVTYVDCDVEEPNGHIFLKPQIETIPKATMLYPVVDEDKCISCGKCAEICQFKAIIMIGEKPLVFPEMCHDCGGCYSVCPADAVALKEREIGMIETGHTGKIRFVHGKLAIGQVMSPPLIKAVKLHIPEDGLVIVDCPPGTSCPVIEALHGADYALLVTEPTPFGLNDLKLAVEVLKELGIKFGVFINRYDIGTQDTMRYCEKGSIPVLAQLPDDNRIAEAYSKGLIVTDELPEYRTCFMNLLSALKREVK
ncbi:MAG: P-loop NTPase [Candidatus Latescibacteria bacterium]|jgi:MinD superfamily P-loop ATPase|nr:P-loop NTPase [Candidatus Latescibacterota bacterium]